MHVTHTHDVSSNKCSIGSLGQSESQYWEANLWSDSELNPGFYDPFHVSTVTFTGYNGWYYAKVSPIQQHRCCFLLMSQLDHLRLRGLHHMSVAYGGELKDIGEGEGMSDHRWLAATVALGAHTASHHVYCQSHAHRASIVN